MPWRVYIFTAKPRGSRSHSGEPAAPVTVEKRTITSVRFPVPVSTSAKVSFEMSFVTCACAHVLLHYSFTGNQVCLHNFVLQFTGTAATRTIRPMHVSPRQEHTCCQSACLKEAFGNCASWVHKTLWYELPIEVHQPFHCLDVLQQDGSCTTSAPWLYAQVRCDSSACSKPAK